MILNIMHKDLKHLTSLLTSIPAKAKVDKYTNEIDFGEIESEYQIKYERPKGVHRLLIFKINENVG